MIWEKLNGGFNYGSIGTETTDGVEFLNTFGAHINEQLIMEMADTMVAEGYKEAGYEYVIIDDCWSLRRSVWMEKLVADPELFPHGMKALADYIHGKGLKFGMYSCAGTKTLCRIPGKLWS